MVSAHRRASPAINVELSILSVFLGTRHEGEWNREEGKRDCKPVASMVS